MYTIRLGSDERKGLYIALGMCKNFIHLRVCRIMSLVFVILDSWYDR